jgi:integrase
VLTELRCRSAKPAEKAYKLADAKGLYLYVTPTGYKSWRWKYLAGKVEKRLTFGPYPDISLAEARILREEAARLKRQGLDPGAERKKAKAAEATVEVHTFETIARRWHKRKKALWSETHATYVLRSLETDVFPAKSESALWQGRLGDLPIGTVSARMVLQVLHTIEERGAVDQAHRIRQRVSDVFVFAIAEDLADNNPAAALGKALLPARKRRYPAFVKLEDARRVLSLTEAEPCYPSTKLASRLMAITAARTTPVRYAAPDEFEDLDGPAPLWRIPAAKMKLQLAQKDDEGFEFIVPLPHQAVDVVRAALALAGPHSRLLFPSPRHVHKPISENAISSLYKRFPAIRGRHVPHGWRSSFSTIMNEWAVAEKRLELRAIIDLMLAHKPEGVEAAYNRAAYMSLRREIAQRWADMLMEGMAPAEQLLKGPRH